MISDKLENINQSETPVIIIGSGPAGISIALELEKKKIKCLVIEAGDQKYNHLSQQNYKGEIVGDQISNLTHCRLRQFGGTSGHWGGWAKPLEEYDFKNWNIKKTDLSKYSNETCKILNIKNIFNKSKLNDNFNQIQFQYSKVRFAKKFKSNIQKSKYIHLILNTQLSHFVGKNKITESLVCFSNNKKYILKAKYFILACGGIENSRILLWTKEKNSSFINPALPIGKYWMTHPWILAGVGILKKRKIKSFLKNEFIDEEGPLHFASTKELIKEKKIFSGAIYMNAQEDTKIYKEVIKDILCIAPELGKKIARKVLKKDLKCGNIFMNLEEEANTSNQITLHKNLKDNVNMPITKLYYKKSRSTLITAKTILEEFGNMCRKLDLGRIAIKDEIYNLNSYENLGAHHHMGGTRMGADKNTSVVDNNLKVHDNQNLFIAGSSVFSSSGYSNPTYTIIQLSLRLADEIKIKL
jgi:hypothetical protein